MVHNTILHKQTNIDSITALERAQTVSNFEMGLSPKKKGEGCLSYDTPLWKQNIST